MPEPGTEQETAAQKQTEQAPEGGNENEISTDQPPEETEKTEGGESEAAPKEPGGSAEQTEGAKAENLNTQRFLPVERFNRVYAESKRYKQELERLRKENEHLKGVGDAQRVRPQGTSDIQPQDLGVNAEVASLFTQNPLMATAVVAREAALQQVKAAQQYTDNAIKRIEAKETYLRELRNLGNLEVAKKDPEFMNTIYRIAEEHPELESLEPSAAVRALKGLYLAEAAEYMSSEQAKLQGEGNAGIKAVKEGMTPAGRPAKKPKVKDASDVANMSDADYAEFRKQYGFGVN